MIPPEDPKMTAGLDMLHRTGVPRELDDPAWPVPTSVEGEGFAEPLYRRRRRAH